MSGALRYGAIVVLFALGAACESSVPTSPTGTGQAAPAAPTFPPLSGPARAFGFDRELLSSPVSDYTTRSRFVLYDNGAFALQYEKTGEYRGRYEEANGLITYEWEGWSIAGPWSATGALKGDRLSVQYNQVMLLDDFENAVYVRIP